MKLNRLVALLPYVALMACNVPLPVTVISDTGDVYKGVATTAVAYGGSFSATNGRVVCSGQYDAFNAIKTTSFPVSCSNRLTGFATVTRNTSGKGGSGTIAMSDGSIYTVVFGALTETS